VKTRYLAALLISAVLGGGAVASAGARQVAPAGSARSPSFTAKLSNNTPLVFGMDVEDVSRTLGEPLSYIGGRPGDEIYLAFRNIGGSGLFNRRDRRCLQFRRGRFAGLKGDWGHNWMWQ
jgi:hypothetical protein